MPLIHCKINLVPTWSANCVISPNTASNQETIFVITDTKLHVPVITLSTDCNVNVQQQLKSGLNAQLTGINFNQKCWHRRKTNI